MMTLGRIANVAAALLLCAAGVGVIVQALAFPAASSGGAPGPARLPLIYAGLLCVSGIALAVGALRADAEGVSVQLHGTGRAMVLAGSTIAYLALLPVLGFVAASLLWFVVVVLFLERRWRPAVIGAAVLVPGVYVIFRLVLSVPLP